VVSTQDGDALVIVEFAAQAAQSEAGIEEVLRGAAAQGANEPGLHQFQLPVEKGAAIGHFVGQRRAIAGRPAFDDVANIDFVALEATGGNDPVEQLPGGADKGKPLGVFIRSGRLANEAQVHPRAAVPEHRLLARGDKLGTFATSRYFLSQELQGLAAILRGSEW